ncbi:MAG: hypothetical protein U5R49_22095 [Deltaproteobacteria bacterium]|nr:hypothetical protein [Deltaproteobacteria bacterium]
MMNIPSAHKNLLRKLGLGDEDFTLFDGEWVTYEYDSEKGVRLYDPYYRTTYDEYIGIDGWSAWSVEEDSFMSDILKPTREAVARSKIGVEKAESEPISEALQKKFGAKADKSET